MSSFHDLCPDILLELFTYFSFNELFDIFREVVHCLPALLHNGHAKLHLHWTSNKQLWKEALLVTNRDQIYSLNISRATTDEVDLTQFPSLRSLVLEDSRMSNVFSFVQFNSLRHLERISLRLSDRIVSEDYWLAHLLQLTTVKYLSIELMTPMNTIISQRDILISPLSYQSSSVKYLAIKIPLLWKSILALLSHFPSLETFRACLYRIKFHQRDTLTSKTTLECFQSLRTLDLTGYFSNLSTTITLFCSSIVHLKSCRLMATSVINDSISDIIIVDRRFFWTHFFRSCSSLNRIKIHMLIAIKSQMDFDTDSLKHAIRLFENHTICKQYNLFIIQTSMHNGYLTLICHYKKPDEKKRHSTSLEC